MSTVTTHKLGPGQLTIGETASAEEFGVRVSKVTLTPDVKEEDPVRVLSGDYLEDSDPDAVKWTLKGSIYQDYEASSLLVWCYENNGKTLPFVYRPRADQPLEVIGMVKIRPVEIGGKVDERNEADFEFQAPAVEVKATTL